MKKYESIKHGTAEFPVGIHDTICENGFSLYPHIHNELEFLVIEEGKGTMYIEEEKFELKKGEGVFINSGELHIGIKTDSKKARFFAVVFSPEVFGAGSSDAIVRKYVEPVLNKKIQIKRRLDKNVTALLEKIHESEGELKIKALLYEVWDECIKGANENTGGKSKGVEDIKTVMEYIRENCDKSISLDDIAKSVNMSKGYLCREFKRVVHMTPFEYLIKIRIDKGCELLKETDLSIGEIAQLCGFNSFSYFTKVFGSMIGYSPSEYRQL